MAIRDEVEEKTITASDRQTSPSDSLWTIAAISCLAFQAMTLGLNAFEDGDIYAKATSIRTQMYLFSCSSILSKIPLYWKWLYALDVYIQTNKKYKFNGDFHGPEDFQTDERKE